MLIITNILTLDNNNQIYQVTQRSHLDTDQPHCVVFRDTMTDEIIYYTQLKSNEYIIYQHNKDNTHYQIKTSHYWSRGLGNINDHDTWLRFKQQLGITLDLLTSLYQSSFVYPLSESEINRFKLMILKHYDTELIKDLPIYDIDGQEIDEEHESYYYTNSLERITQDTLDSSYDYAVDNATGLYDDIDNLTFIQDLEIYTSDTEDYYQCYITGDLYSEDSIVRGSNFNVNQDLFDMEYTLCENCGNIIHQDEAHYTDYDCYCENCYDDESSPIRDYHSRPELTFYTVNDKFNGGYGVELEVDSSSTSTPRDLAEDIINNIEEVWCSNDGSLHNGVEIISHPMTMDYIMKEFKIYELCDIIINNDFKSHDTNTCGLHVHASRSLFGNNKMEQELNIAKILLIFDRFFDNEITKFSRRRYEALERWAEKPNANINYTDSEDTISNKIRRKTANGRYQAVNLINRETIEFRIFRGTTRASTLLASIQFVDELIKYVRTHSLYTCTIVKFATIFKNTQYQELKNYLLEKELLTTKKQKGGNV